jgi:hypothetical protein
LIHSPAISIRKVTVDGDMEHKDTEETLKEMYQARAWEMYFRVSSAASRKSALSGAGGMGLSPAEEGSLASLAKRGVFPCAGSEIPADLVFDLDL